MSALVLDNTPLSHFARAGALAVLESITLGYRCIAPAQVVQELLQGITAHPLLATAVNLPWVEVVELTDVNEIVAFARYKAELGGGVERNNGEAAVLAWASVHGGTAVIDERAGTRAARRDHIDVHGTLWLVANAVRSGKLSEQNAIRMVDQPCCHGHGPAC